MATMPLIAHQSPAAVVAYRGGMAVSALSFISDVNRVAKLLPMGRHVLNACVDRYQFTVAFAACLLTEKISLLPPTYLPEVIHHLRDFASDVFCLTDGQSAEVDLPTVIIPDGPAALTERYEIPRIGQDQIVAHVFTSGSTGTPVPHLKTWGRLVDNVRIGAHRLGFNDDRPRVVVATVPPQHMYGFESSVLVALQSGQAFCAERPFYPIDIAGTLARLPRPLVLVTTPIHLRAMLASEVTLPALDLVLCATAPLDLGVAQATESRLGAPLLEIYGTTETGQIASRRPTLSAEWNLWPGVELRQHDGVTTAAGGHIEKPTPLGDIVEILANNHFKLMGRVEDLINIAGKRSSLAYLNHQLTNLPGVQDGSFYLREEPAAASVIGSPRLGALVVCPGVSAETILRGLKARIDPVFLPRPLQLVDVIPRNSTGKLIRATVDLLISR
jgi:acyl-coenzyme A synthetase/AMP-(fatty) acid ligase